MKKYIAVLLPLVLTCVQSSAQIVARNESPNPNYNYQQSATFIAKLDRKAEAMKQDIRKTKTKANITGRSYYVAANGDDANDGLSPQKPLKSLTKVNSLDLQAGDGVLLRRGDLWRGSIRSKSGVTYSAYGKGDKPKIYGSPCDAAKEGKWTETETPNVYSYDMELPNDIGTLVFNDGAACAVKVLKQKLPDGSTVHLGTKESFNDYRDLKVDLEFYHDYKDAKRLYLYSSKGNPAKRFKSIELLVKTNIIYAKDNITVDNLCLKYCGAHGVGSGTTKGLTVTNCEIGWIGGSIQGESLYGRSFATRYGNGIEVYGGCKHYLVDNCYIYQVYDAGITHQFSTGGNDPIVMKNVTYSNNLVEDCVYAIEYFVGKAANDSERRMDSITIYNNVLRRSGFGWGMQRPDKETPVLIKSWNHYNQASNFIIRNNIFDRGAVGLLDIEADKEEWLPALQKNTYIQFTDIPAGTLGSKRTKYAFDKSISEALKTLFKENDPILLYVAPLGISHN